MNTIGFHRGYTGHEMLGEFGTIGGTTLAGGLTSDMLGGSILSGAISDMNIGMFNHGWITNAQGENVYMLDDVVVNGRLSMPCLKLHTLNAGSYIQAQSPSSFLLLPYHHSGVRCHTTLSRSSRQVRMDIPSQWRFLSWDES